MKHAHFVDAVSGPVDDTTRSPAVDTADITSRPASVDVFSAAFSSKPATSQPRSSGAGAVEARVGAPRPWTNGVEAVAFEVGATASASPAWLRACLNAGGAPRGSPWGLSPVRLPASPLPGVVQVAFVGRTWCGHRLAVSIVAALVEQPADVATPPCTQPQPGMLLDAAAAGTPQGASQSSRRALGEGSRWVWSVRAEVRADTAGVLGTVLADLPRWFHSLTSGRLAIVGHHTAPSSTSPLAHPSGVTDPSSSLHALLDAVCNRGGSKADEDEADATAPTAGDSAGAAASPAGVTDVADLFRAFSVAVPAVATPAVDANANAHAAVDEVVPSQGQLSLTSLLEQWRAVRGAMATC